MPTGLFIAHHLNNIVAAMRAVEAHWASLNSESRRDRIVNQAFAELHALQIPPPTLTLHHSSNRGAFHSEDWTLNLNPTQRLIGIRTTQMRLKIADMGGLVAHEARHCEQEFRVGRLWRDRQRTRRLTVDARDLHQRLKIHRPTAEKIMAAPRLINPFEIHEAEQWYQSFFGSGRSFGQAVFDRVGDVGQGGLRETDTSIGRQYQDTAFARYARGLSEENDAHCLQYEVERLYLLPYALHADPPDGHWPVRAGVSEY